MSLKDTKLVFTFTHRPTTFSHCQCVELNILDHLGGKEEGKEGKGEGGRVNGKREHYEGLFGVLGS